MQDDEMRQRVALLQDRHPGFTVWTSTIHPVGWRWHARTNVEPVVKFDGKTDQDLDDALIVFERQLQINEERHQTALRTKAGNSRG